MRKVDVFVKVEFWVRNGDLAVMIFGKKTRSFSTVDRFYDTPPKKNSDFLQRTFHDCSAREKDAIRKMAS